MRPQPGCRPAGSQKDKREPTARASGGVIHEKHEDASGNRTEAQIFLNAVLLPTTALASAQIEAARKCDKAF